MERHAPERRKSLCRLIDYTKSRDSTFIYDDVLLESCAQPLDHAIVWICDELDRLQKENDELRARLDALTTDGK